MGHRKHLKKYTIRYKNLALEFERVYVARSKIKALLEFIDTHDMRINKIISIRRVMEDK